MFFPDFNFSIDLISFSYSSFNQSVLMQLNLVVDPSHGIPVFYCLSHGPLLLFSKCSFAQLVVMECAGIALLPQSTLVYGLQWTYCFQSSNPEVRRASFRAIPQSTKIIKSNGLKKVPLTPVR